MTSFVSPITQKPLAREKDALVTEDRTESYPIVNGVPILLIGDTVADWRREIMEVLLWQYPEKFDEMRAKRDRTKAPSALYIEYITDLLKDKEGILAAMRGYSQDNTARWNVTGPEPVPPSEIKSFNWRNSRKFARRMVRTAKKNGSHGWARHLPKYVELVHESKPQSLLELSTGAGLGLSAVARVKARDCTMYTMDIGYACHGNSVSIAKYLRIQDSLLPVCANFWHMPFAPARVDAVCAHYGLDESREVGLTVAEVARVLKPGGRFINVSRSSADLRSFDLFEPFGFTREEMVEVCKMARLYGDTQGLIDACAECGLALEERHVFPTARERTGEVVISVFLRK